MSIKNAPIFRGRTGYANVLPYVDTFYQKSKRFFVNPVENLLPVEDVAIFFIKSNDNTF